MIDMPSVFGLLQITIPMFILNAIDDPLVPEHMHEIPRKFACKSSAIHVHVRVMAEFRSQ